MKMRYGSGRREVSGNAGRLFCWERSDGLVEIGSPLTFVLCASSSQEETGDSTPRDIEVTCEAHLEPQTSLCFWADCALAYWERAV